MSEMSERVARLLMVARGCDEADSAAKVAFPCPFCHWSKEAKEESGCVVWAEKIIAAMREPTEAMLKAGGEYNCTGDYPNPGAAWRDMINEALK